MMRTLVLSLAGALALGLGCSSTPRDQNYGDGSTFEIPLEEAHLDTAAAGTTGASGDTGTAGGGGADGSAGASGADGSAGAGGASGAGGGAGSGDAQQDATTDAADAD